MLPASCKRVWHAHPPAASLPLSQRLYLPLTLQLEAVGVKQPTARGERGRRARVAEHVPSLQILGFRVEVFPKRAGLSITIVHGKNTNVHVIGGASPAHLEASLPIIMVEPVHCMSGA